MTKKQFGIIFTLMALIVCVGVLSIKLNKDGLIDPTDLSSVLSPETLYEGGDEGEETSGTQDNFYSIRTQKEQQNAATLQQLTSVKDDESVSQEQRDIATNEYTQKTMLIDQEGRIEQHVKNEGYEDALCFIEDNRVRVLVRADALTSEESSSIQEIVEDVSSISNVIIEPKK